MAREVASAFANGCRIVKDLQLQQPCEVVPEEIVLLFRMAGAVQAVATS